VRGGGEPAHRPVLGGLDGAGGAAHGLRGLLDAVLVAAESQPDDAALGGQQLADGGVDGGVDRVGLGGFGGVDAAVEVGEVAGQVVAGARLKWSAMRLRAMVMSQAQGSTPRQDQELRLASART